MDTCKVSLSPLWISWLILDYYGLSKIVVTYHWGDIIRQTSVFTMFEMLNSQKGFPTTIWVKAYLGGTTKNHPPQNHRNFSSLRCLQSKSMWNVFLVFTSLHKPYFSTSNLLWNYCRFCKWHFLSPMHLICNKFNVHGVAHIGIFHPRHHFTQKTTIVE